MKKFKAGNYRQQYKYKSFSPSLINRSYLLDDAVVLELLTEASRFLGELNGYSRLIPDVDFFIRMHVNKEAIQSSHIEGTQTTFDEIFLKEEDIDPDRRNDWREVRNYTEALNVAIEKLETLPLSMRSLKETHKILMKDVRGKHKSPGEIRRSQNWIGGSSLQDAFFIPPHHSELGDLLSDLEKFWHNEAINVPILIRAAISHYQFETIHPFLDGNGRIGRLLITLFLIDQKVLSKPTLYLSDFFERNKGAYYDSLTVVRHSDDLTQWVRFFLRGVIETSQKSIQTFEKIIVLREKVQLKIHSLGRKVKAANQLLLTLYSCPIIDSKFASQILEVKHPTANSLIEDFESLGILKEITGYKRNRLYAFQEYLAIFER